MISVTRQNFPWVAGLVIFAWPPLVGAVCMIAFATSIVLRPRDSAMPETIGYVAGASLPIGLLTIALAGLPVLAVRYRVGVWRALASVGAGLVHAAAWAILMVTTPLALVLGGPFVLPMAMDIIGTAACAVMMWRGRRRSVADHEEIAGQFD